MIDIESQIIGLVALEKIYVPISSMEGKLKRSRPKVAKEINRSYDGKRVYTRFETTESSKARGMKEGIKKFEKKFPEYGKLLEKCIKEERKKRKTNLYFGLHEGCRLNSEEYVGVLTSLGFTPRTAERLYPELMDISNRLAKKRKYSERSILIG